MYKGTGPIKDNLRRSSEFGNPSAVLCKKLQYQFLESPKNEYQNIGISISTTLSVRVPNKAKLFHEYLKGTKLREIDLSKISVSN